MKTTAFPPKAGVRAYITSLLVAICLIPAAAQSPEVTVRFANPDYDCLAGIYCVDVEFMCNVPGQRIFGQNVRFFYPDTLLDLIGFTDFVAGYGPVDPNPPTEIFSMPGGPALFNFTGPAIFVNGAIQLVDPIQPPVFLDAGIWTRLYRVCFNVTEEFTADSVFCPPLVWDLEQDPANGGFLVGDDGVVITLVNPANPNESIPAVEQVEQFNWVYAPLGAPTPPYGFPAPINCIASTCFIDLALEKSYLSGPDTVRPGDDVVFTIRVTNEGNIPVGEITVIDYIPIGLSLNDPAWTAGTNGSSGQSATRVLSIANGLLPADGLDAGEFVDVTITLQVSGDAVFGELENIAEILTVLNSSGVDVTDQDVDSQPDNDDTNDPEEEDDHDTAVVCIYVEPGLTGVMKVCEGSEETYTVVPFDPTHTYTFSFSEPGVQVISQSNGSITVLWDFEPGTMITITVTATDGECQASGEYLVMVQTVEPMACVDHINVSIADECGTMITSGMVLRGEMEGDEVYDIYIIDANGDTIPDGKLTWEHVGQTFMVSVVNACTWQSCWAWMTVEDKMPPRIECVCPEDNESERCRITCLHIDDFLAGDIPPSLRPVVIDDCGGTMLELVNVDLHYETCGDGYILVSWLATDHAGNTATCVQEFTIDPLTLDGLVFPGEYLGGCQDPSHPDYTGWPTIDGLNVTDIPTYCNVVSSYTDQVVQLCGEGRKIIRHWQVFDWCTMRVLDGFQTIYLKDTAGPVIPPIAPIHVNAGPWECSADVIIPRPQATDACSDIKSYQLFAPSGVVTQVGVQYIVYDLEVGSHVLRWVVTDECHNVSTAEFEVTVRDISPPAMACHHHTVVSLTEERLGGITLVPAQAFDDGSRDNCSAITFRARRMDSCIDVDWTTGGACVDETPGGTPAINEYDLGTAYAPCVPFSCCDLGGPPVMVQLEVTDAEGNVNYCMVEVTVQDKLAPKVTCPADIIVSCDFPFEILEGTITDVNQDGSLDEDPLSEIFGNVYDAARHDESVRQPIIINDPNNPEYPQPYNWGIDGWATDYCRADLSVTIEVLEDCSGNNFVNAPEGTVKLIRRRFIANDGSLSGSCVQRIYVVDFTPFYISDETCGNENPNDGVIWPCDVVISTCDGNLEAAGEPVIFEDGCSLVAMTYRDTRYDFAEEACFKILREWSVIDWCQFDGQTGAGIWTYTQEIKVADAEGATFLACPAGPVELCTTSPGVRLPANNQIFLGEGDPASTSCSVHVSMSQTVSETCSGSVIYDVKIYPFDGLDFIQIKPETVVELNADQEAVLSFDTETSGLPGIQDSGLPYTSAACGEYHRVLWTVEDGCGNRSFCEYLFRLEDCKAPSPVCLNGISTVIMAMEGEVTIWASDFEASSTDDCTPSALLEFSFSETEYQPSFTYNCDNVPAFGVEIPVEIWVADEGVDQDCDGQISWAERNKDVCITYIIITDPNSVCEEEGAVLAGEIMTSQHEAVSTVSVHVTSPGVNVPAYVTAENGVFNFSGLPAGLTYTVSPERLDDPKNGVSTLDLVRMQKHLLGQEPFTDTYQYFAADANKSGSVSAIDLIEVRKLILGMYDAFPNNTSWRFVREGAVAGQGQPWQYEETATLDLQYGQVVSDLDFVGIKVGDVNATARANAHQVLPRGARDVLRVTAVEQTNHRESGLREVKFILPRDLIGFQWTLELDGLEWVGVRSRDIPIDESNIGLPKEGRVTMSWNGQQHADDTDQDIALILTFRPTRDDHPLDQALTLSGSITAAEAYTPEGEILDVELVVGDAGSRSDFALHQNLPNPFREQTLIGFDLPVDGEAVLTVFDAAGQVVHRVRGNYTAGYNSILLHTQDIPAGGVLYYQLEAGELSATRRMVRIR